MSGNVKARVQVTLDVDAGSTWDFDCHLSQVYKQARDDTERTIRAALHKSDVRMVGEMKITAVLIEERKP